MAKSSSTTPCFWVPCWVWVAFSSQPRKCTGPILAYVGLDTKHPETTLFQPGSTGHWWELHRTCCILGKWSPLSSIFIFFRAGSDPLKSTTVTDRYGEVVAQSGHVDPPPQVAHCPPMQRINLKMQLESQWMSMVLQTRKLNLVFDVF